jgi:predicted TPR repeat methyltransferase
MPAELQALVTSVAGGEAEYCRVLDLGCGTGLAGERFRRSCSWLEGVDLSGGMIALARRKALYDVLEVGGLAGFLGVAPRR